MLLAAPRNLDGMERAGMARGGHLRVTVTFVAGYVVLQY